MKQKPGVILFWETFETFKHLSDSECKQLISAIYEYARNNVYPDFNDRALNLIWQTIQYRIDEDSRRYQDICEKRSSAGKKGAENRWQNEQEEAIIANAITNNKDNQHNTTQHNTTQLNSI